MRHNVTVSLDSEVWEQFKAACEALRYVPSRELERLMTDWLRGLGRGPRSQQGGSATPSLQMNRPHLLD